MTRELKNTDAGKIEQEAPYPKELAKLKLKP